jgi:hypothetical protein
MLATVLTTLAALSTLLAALARLVLTTLLLLAGLLLSAAALLRVALVLLLVATRFVLAWIVRHWTFSSDFEGFARRPSRPNSTMRGQAFCSGRERANSSQWLEK